MTNRLNFTTGVEFTFIPRDAGTKYNAAHMPSAALAGFRRRVAQLGARFSSVDTDPHVLEASTTRCRHVDKLLQSYRCAWTAARELRLDTHHPVLGGGGGHVHQSGGALDTMTTRVAVARLITDHPEVNWGFNSPEDIGNARSMLTLARINARWLFGKRARAVLTAAFEPGAECVHIGGEGYMWEYLYYYGLTPSGESVATLLSGASGKSNAVYLYTAYGTLEHRYFDMPRAEEELLQNVNFAEALVLHAAANQPALLARRSLASYPAPARYAAKRGRKGATVDLLDFITELGLDYREYERRVAANIATRFEWGTAK